MIKETSLEDLVSKDGFAIQSIENPSEKLQLAAVRENGLSIKYIKNPSEKVQLAAVKRNGLLIQSIEQPNEKVQLAAVKQKGTAIRYIKNPSEKVQLAAVRENGIVIYYIEKPSKKVKKEAILNRYKVYVLNEATQLVKVGSEAHTAQEWLNFSNKEIYEMDGDYTLEFYPYLVKFLKKRFKLS